MAKKHIHGDVMVDLETTGRRAGCGILSIGAVAFSPGKKLGEEHYAVVRLASCEEAGLHSDAGTLQWWSEQKKEAKEVLRLSGLKKYSKPLREELEAFNAYLSRFGADVRVWGNGSDFDNAILYAAYAAVGLEPAWKFWNSRCFRTLKGLHPAVPMARGGTHHNALDDAKTQAVHAAKLLALQHNAKALVRPL